MHRFDGIGEVLARALGFAVGLFQRGVRGVQKIQRAFEVARALTHLIFQKRRTLKLGIGRAAVIGDLFDPPHQHLCNRQELFDLALRRVGGVEDRIGQRPPPSAGSGG